MEHRDYATGWQTPDAITLLTDQHQKIRRLFEEFDNLGKQPGNDNLKSETAKEICLELNLQADIEEMVLYPAVHAASDDRELTHLLNEAQIEHASARELIRQLETLPPTDDYFDAIVKVLRDYISQHMKREEEILFPRLQRIGFDARAVGRQLNARKRDLINGWTPARHRAFQTRGLHIVN